MAYSQSNLNRKQYRQITDISKRADALLGGNKIDRVTLEMDMEAVSEHTPIDFGKLLKCPKADFIHDICGIQKNINRNTGKLENCFSPRTAK